jgi:hypothetical protein
MIENTSETANMPSFVDDDAEMFELAPVSL